MRVSWHEEYFLEEGQDVVGEARDKTDESTSDVVSRHDGPGWVSRARRPKNRAGPGVTSVRTGGMRECYQHFSAQPAAPKRCPNSHPFLSAGKQSEMSKRSQESSSPGSPMANKSMLSRFATMRICGTRLFE